ncbi:hypothetical protein GQ54DRAFT_115104 [Martensiomyces pterosporus]|nr:hypothetical protein GQ54DRAFT_115104 [Martensiomyces pterosporus]
MRTETTATTHSAASYLPSSTAADSGTVMDAEAEEQAPARRDPMVLDRVLPQEILGLIFVFAQWPSLALVSRAFHAVSRSKAVRAHYYLQEFGRHRVLDGKLGLAGRRPQLIRQDLVLMLLNLGADPRADEQWIFRHACAKGWVTIVRKVLRMCLYDVPAEQGVGARKVLGEVPQVQLSGGYDSGHGSDAIGESSSLDNWRGVRQHAAQAGAPTNAQATVHGSGAAPMGDTPPAVRARQGGRQPSRTLLIDVHAEENEALRIAAGLGHTAVVRALIEGGADVNAMHSEPLVLAASNCQLETAKLLIASGASAVEDHSRALRSAVLVGDSNIECVLALLDGGAVVQAMDDSCLLAACYKGDGEFPPPPPLSSYFGGRAAASGAGAMSRIELLKYSYAGVPSHGSLYNTPAIRSGMPGASSPSLQMRRQPRRYRNMAQTMAGFSGSPPEHTRADPPPPPQTVCSSATSMTPGAAAVQTPAQQPPTQGRVNLDDVLPGNPAAAASAVRDAGHSPPPTTHIGLVRLLLARGANVNARNGRPAIYACSRGSVRTAAILLAYGADVHVQNEEPLREAAARGHLEIIRLLLSAGSDIHVDNEAPLRNAARGGHLPAVRELIAQGAVTGGRGGTQALCAAARAGWIEVVKELICAGADAQDEEFRACAAKSRALRRALGMGEPFSSSPFGFI